MPEHPGSSSIHPWLDGLIVTGVVAPRCIVSDPRMGAEPSGSGDSAMCRQPDSASWRKADCEFRLGGVNVRGLSARDTVQCPALSQRLWRLLRKAIARDFRAAACGLSVFCIPLVYFRLVQCV